MEDSNDRNPPGKGVKAALIAGGLLAGGAVAGIVGVSSANAATPAATTTAYSIGTGTTNGDGHQRSDEQIVTGSKAGTLRAAALKAVPGGTVERIETDAGDAAYEVHMTKADGSRVTVKFDSNLKETAVEDGMGKGDPRPSGSRGGPSGSSSSPSA